MILTVFGNMVETEERRMAGILERDDMYIVLQFPGRSRYIDSVNGSQYDPTWIAVEKILTTSEGGRIIQTETVIKFNLRR
jgi:hypothetical protein